MNKINILYFTHLFFPLNIVSATRATKLMKYLPEDLQATVITTNSDVKCLESEQMKGNVTVLRFPIKKIISLKNHTSDKTGKFKLYNILKFYLRDLIFYPDKNGWWYIRKIPFFLKLIKQKRIDILLATGDPFSTFLTVYILKLMTKIPYIIDYRDPWSENKSCNYQTFIRRWMNLYFEKKCVQNAHGIISTTQQIEDRTSHFQTGARKLIIPNGFDPEDFEFITTTKKNPHYTFVYTGKFSLLRPDYNPETVIKAFINFFSTNYIDDTRLIFMGNTDETTRLWIEGLESKYIEILPRATKKEALLLQSNADCLIHFYYPQTHIETISMKIFEYAMQKKPIISFNCNEGEIYDFLKENEIGFSVSNSNIEEMAKAYYKVYSGEFQIKEDSIDLGKYDYKYLSQKFANIITKVLDRNKKFINNLE
jgi:glycosyltransferase involved in cell wall biosynthesis